MATRPRADGLGLRLCCDSAGCTRSYTPTGRHIATHKLLLEIAHVVGWRSVDGEDRCRVHSGASPLCKNGRYWAGPKFGMVRE